MEWDKWAVVARRAGQDNRRHNLPKVRQHEYHGLQNNVFSSSSSRFYLISLHVSLLYLLSFQTVSSFLPFSIFHLCVLILSS